MGQTRRGEIYRLKHSAAFAFWLTAMGDLQSQIFSGSSTAIRSSCAVDGESMLRRKDVGRHNAVDKVIGRPRRIIVRKCCLSVTERRFEIMRKALVARTPIVARPLDFLSVTDCRDYRAPLVSSGRGDRPSSARSIPSNSRRGIQHCLATRALKLFG
ncbi:MAG: hypothetical protein E6J74_36830 [Deltaproteobacteria bacterium]|nr:MAG: hypothetical protein E6J74_36830 [Deltaproteobacteria bacterium]